MNPSFPKVMLGGGVVASVIVLLLALRADPAAAQSTYKAEIRTDRHGLPHIAAGDWGGPGFGYAFARANIRVNDPVQRRRSGEHGVGQPRLL